MLIRVIKQDCNRYFAWKYPSDTNDLTSEVLHCPHDCSENLQVVRRGNIIADSDSWSEVAKKISTVRLPHMTFSSILLVSQFHIGDILFLTSRIEGKRLDRGYWEMLHTAH